MVERILEVNHETFVHTEMNRQKLTVPDYHSTELLNNDTILFILHVLSKYEVIALPNMTRCFAFKTIHDRRPTDTNMTENFSLKALVGLSDVISYN